MSQVALETKFYYEFRATLTRNLQLSKPKSLLYDRNPPLMTSAEVSANQRADKKINMHP